MASGGMYDHIGGGFARYSVDREWLVPHFEKMLYDQALLVRVYAHAAVALTTSRAAVAAGRRPRPSSTCCATCARPAGGFSSAEDADSPGPDGHGHEGLFHTWTRRRGARRARRRRRRRPRLLRHHARPATSRAGRSPTGCTRGAVSARPPAIEDARRRLFEAREQRPRPGLDDKVLTEWNALMIAGARRGGRAARPAGLDRRRRRGRRLPPPRAAAARRAVVPLVARRRRRRRPVTTRSPPTTPCLVDAFTRLAEATGEAPLDRRGARPWPTRCSTTSGTSTTAGCSRHPTTARRSSPGRRTCSTTPPRRPTRPPPSPCTASPRSPARRATPTTPTASCSSSARSSTRRRRRSPTPSPPSPSVSTGSPRSPSSATVPTSSPSSPSGGAPTSCWPGASRYDSPLWAGRTDGLAYVCRALRLPGAAGHARRTARPVARPAVEVAPAVALRRPASRRGG